jgi:hypothetical protein
MARFMQYRSIYAILMSELRPIHKACQTFHVYPERFSTWARFYAGSKNPLILVARFSLQDASGSLFDKTRTFLLAGDFDQKAHTYAAFLTPRFFA